MEPTAPRTEGERERERKTLSKTPGSSVRTGGKLHQMRKPLEGAVGQDQTMGIDKTLVIPIHLSI